MSSLFKLDYTFQPPVDSFSIYTAFHFLNINETSCFFDLTSSHALYLGCLTAPTAILPPQVSSNTTSIHFPDFPALLLRSHLLYDTLYFSFGTLPHILLSIPVTPLSWSPQVPFFFIILKAFKEPKRTYHKNSYLLSISYPPTSK